MGKRETQQFSIGADHLLNALRAVIPLASKDAKNDPHLTQVRFVIGPGQLELSATDGSALGKVIAPLDHGSADGLQFCVQTSFLPTLTRALSRVKEEHRKTLQVEFAVNRFRIDVAIADSGVAIPNAAEQLLFPDVEKAIPIPSTSHRTAVTGYGVSPSLLARVMKAASHIAVSVQQTAPADPLSAIRFDVVDGVGELAATYVVMPMNMGVPSAEVGEDDEPRTSQLAIEGAEPRAKGGVKAAVDNFLGSIPKGTSVTISSNTGAKPVTVKGKGRDRKAPK